MTWLRLLNHLVEPRFDLRSFFLIFSFTCLAVSDLSCGMWDLVPCLGIEPCIGSAVLATGPPGKFQPQVFFDPISSGCHIASNYSMPATLPAR